MFRSIRIKILVLQTGLVISVVAALGLVAYLMMFHSLRDDQQQNLEYIAADISKEVSELIEVKKQALGRIGTSDTVKSYFKNRQERMLVEYFSKFRSEFPVLSYVNEDGLEELKLINGVVSTEPSNIRDSAVFEEATQTPNKAVSLYLASCPELGGAPSVEFGFLNKSFFDEFTGFILAKVTVYELIKDEFQEYKIEQSGRVIVIDSEGTHLCCRHKDKTLKKITVERVECLDLERVISGIKAGKSGFGRAAISGVDSYFAYSPVPGQNWSVVTILPYKEFLARLYPLRNTVLLVGFAILVVGTALSLFLANNITEPILKLTGVTNWIAKGDFSQRVHTKSKDEIGTLAEAFNRMLENLKNTTTSMVNLNREITERKQFEEELQSLHKQVEFILGATKTGLDIIDSDFNMVYIDPQWQKIYGEYKGKKCYEYFMDRDQPCPGCGIPKALETKELVVTEEILVKEGNRPIQVTTIPFQDKKGKWMVAEVNADITERKKTEETLRESEERYKNLFKANTDGILIADPTTKKFRYANPAICRMLGYSEEELTQMSVADIHPKESLEQVFAEFEALASGAKITAKDLLCIRKDGQVISVSINAGKVMIDRTKYLLAMFRDITERKQTEEKLKELNEEMRNAVAKLEEVNGELKNFVYIASHDMREPLRKITAFGAILRQSLKDKLSSDDAENLHFMIDGAERMAKMIEGLLTYSRIGTQVQPHQAVDLNEIVKQLQQFELSVLLEEKHATIEIPQPLPCVEVDPVQIRQLMQNLIANGVKYQKKGNMPHITITTKPAADGMVRIEVTDNGIGIAPQYLQSIFTMFRRLHSRDEYEGTGIGLAVCKKIVERHGGKISVESEPDKGSTFWFTMPTAKELAAVGEEASRG